MEAISINTTIAPKSQRLGEGDPEAGFVTFKTGHDDGTGPPPIGVSDDDIRARLAAKGKDSTVLCEAACFGR